MPPDKSTQRIVSQVMHSPGNRVKLAVVDIDGILRGKYVHKDKFASAVNSGFGFCDVVYGWDSQDVCYDNTTSTGWHKGFPDAQARIDLSTHRNVPWDGGVDFFLASFVRQGKRGTELMPLDPRQVLARVLARAAKLGLRPMCSLEFEFFNFSETPQSWADKKGVDPEPITPGMFGYSLLRANHSRDYFAALFSEMDAFRVPIEGLHTETGPGVFEAAIVYSDAMEAGDRAVLFKSGAKEIGARYAIMPSFMAKWSQDYPGCSGHCHQSLSDGKRNVFHDANPKSAGRAGMSKMFESYLAGQLRWLLELGPMLWPTINSYKRLVDGFWAPVKPTWGIDNRTASFRVIPGGPSSTRLETRCPGADVNPYLALAACIAAGVAGIENNLKLTAPPIEGTNVGGENIARAPRTLIETTRIFAKSDFARDWFGDEFVDHFAATRDWEWRKWQDAVTDWERKRYFEII
ncbi:MAG: glutamine synthetase [Casimicrobiaceae bacterium]